MKKLISVFMSILIMCLSLLPAKVSASEDALKEYADDGSYFTVSIGESSENEKVMGFFERLISFFMKLIDFFRGQRTVTKSKYLNYYASDGELLWTAELKAEFVYSERSAVCASAVFSMELYDTDWSLLSHECSKEGNTATASFSVRQTKLLVPLKTIEKTMTLSCDTRGNVK